MKHSLSYAALVMAVSALVALNAHAQEWIADTNGCKVWNPRPVLNETVRWSGECEDGYAQGDGILEWFRDGKPNGTTSGEFSGGRINGRATSSAPSGARFSGNYVEGVRTGLGTAIRANGARYDGPYVNDKLHGRGKLTFPSGTVYEGDFVEGRQSGFGKLTSANGWTYEGEFRDGKPHGSGILTDSNGSRQRAQFAEGKRVTSSEAATPQASPPATVAHDSSGGGHSLSSIRAALASPIPAQVLSAAGEFDNRILTTGQINNMRVRPLSNTDIRVTRARQVVERLLRAIKANPAEWTVRVLETRPASENAFVMGGRYIYLHSTLMDNVSGPDELAFILGHELSHALLKHQLRRSEDFSNMLGSILELASLFVRRESAKDALSLSGGAIKALYSREDEQEADALGTYIAARAGFNPARGIAFFQRSVREEKTFEAKIRQDIARGQQVVNQATANCNNLRTQWNSSPGIRTPQNANIVNAACQDAHSIVNTFNAAVRQYATQPLKNVLLRTHPMNEQRIDFLVAATEYVKGQRSLDSLASTGQGYNVFVVLNER